MVGSKRDGNNECTREYGTRRMADRGGKRTDWRDHRKVMPLQQSQRAVTLNFISKKALDLSRFVANCIYRMS